MLENEGTNPGTRMMWQSAIQKIKMGWNNGSPPQTSEWTDFTYLMTVILTSSVMYKNQKKATTRHHPCTATMKMTKIASKKHDGLHRDLLSTRRPWGPRDCWYDSLRLPDSTPWLRTYRKKETFWFLVCTFHWLKMSCIARFVCVCAACSKLNFHSFFVNYSRWRITTIKSFITSLQFLLHSFEDVNSSLSDLPLPLYRSCS